MAHIRQYDVTGRLYVAAEDKKLVRVVPRGHVCARDTQSSTLGRLFKPYISMLVVPMLLTAFGNSTADVREAAQDATRVTISVEGYGDWSVSLACDAVVAVHPPDSDTLKNHTEAAPRGRLPNHLLQLPSPRSS